MSLGRPRSMDPFRRAVNEMFDAMEGDVMMPWGGHQGYPPQRGPFPPSYGGEYGVSLDMHESPEGFELSADLPGMRKEDISIDVDNDTRVLTVSAERKNAQGADDNGFNSQRRIHYRERSFGKMSRSIRLPEMADVAKAGAIYTDGVLTLKFPRLRPLPSGRTHIPVGSGTAGGQLPIAEGPPAGNFTRELPPPAGSPLALPPTEGYGTLALPGGSFQR